MGFKFFVVLILQEGATQDEEATTEKQAEVEAVSDDE